MWCAACTKIVRRYGSPSLLMCICGSLCPEFLRLGCAPHGNPYPGSCGNDADLPTSAGRIRARREALCCPSALIKFAEGAISSSSLPHVNFQDNLSRTFVFGEYATAVPRSYAPIPQKASPRYGLGIREPSARSTNPGADARKGGVPWQKRKVHPSHNRKQQSSRRITKKLVRALKNLNWNLAT